jgi:hypothetical protein
MHAMHAGFVWRGRLRSAYGRSAWLKRLGTSRYDCRSLGSLALGLAPALRCWAEFDSRAIGMIVFVISWKALRVPRNSSNHNQGSRKGQVVDVKSIKVKSLPATKAG